MVYVYYVTQMFSVLCLRCSILMLNCIMSRRSKVSITRELRELQFHNKYQLTIQDIAALLNAKT